MSKTLHLTVSSLYGLVKKMQFTNL